MGRCRLGRPDPHDREASRNDGPGQLITKDTKTQAARRLAPDELGETTLKLHLRVRDNSAPDLGISIGPETPLFTYDHIRPVPIDTVTHYVKRIAVRVGVDTHLHALLPFAASQLVGGGHDPRTVAGRPGRKGASAAIRTSSHMLPERDRDADAALGRALTPG